MIGITGVEVKVKGCRTRNVCLQRSEECSGTDLQGYVRRNVQIALPFKVFALPDEVIQLVLVSASGVLSGLLGLDLVVGALSYYETCAYVTTGLDTDVDRKAPGQLELDVNASLHGELCGDHHGLEVVHGLFAVKGVGEHQSHAQSDLKLAAYLCGFLLGAVLMGLVGLLIVFICLFDSVGLGLVVGLLGLFVCFLLFFSGAGGFLSFFSLLNRLVLRSDILIGLNQLFGSLLKLGLFVVLCLLSDLLADSYGKDLVAGIVRGGLEFVKTSGPSHEESGINIAEEVDVRAAAHCELVEKGKSSNLL